MRLVAARGVAQPVVEVQRNQPVAAGDLDGDVEQADGVAAAREQHDAAAPAYQQPARRDGAQDRLLRGALATTGPVLRRRLARR